MSLLKKIEISELFVVLLALPVASAFAATTNLNINQTINEPVPPVITQLVAHPNISAISIYGTSQYPHQTIFIEDRALSTDAYETHNKLLIRSAAASHLPTAATAVSLKTDGQGNFIAAIPDEHPYSDPGLHNITAYFINQNNDNIIESSLVAFLITEDGLIQAVDGTPSTVTISTKEISLEELENLQAQYGYTAYITGEPLTPEYLQAPQSDSVIDVWEVAEVQIITILLVVIVGISLFLRYLRKDKEGLPFWHIGKGVYKKKD